MQHPKARIVFIILAILAAIPGITAPMALTAGILFGLVTGNPFSQTTNSLSKRLLQLSVIGLGFGIDLPTVLKTGSHAFVYTAISISLTMLLGMSLRRLLATPPRLAMLISFGTAICGGSAIAAMAPVLEAEPEETGMALATVFTLNALGLVLFPPLGHLLGMTEPQFGIWAALAIHDTSSVVGATAAFGATALAIGTTVKLARALWILPCAFGTALIRRCDAQAPFPYFIIGFLAAAATRSFLPITALPLLNLLSGIARQSLVVTLLLIGAGLTRAVIAKTGAKPLILAVLIWIVVATASAAAILSGWIR